MGVCGRPLVSKCPGVVDEVFLTRNSDSMGAISLFGMFKLGSFEVKSILGVLWSTTGH